MSADIKNYLDKIAAANSTDTTDDNSADKDATSTDGEYVEKLASAIEFLVKKASETEGAPNEDSKEDMPPKKDGKKSEGKGESLQDMLKDKIMGAKKGKGDDKGKKKDEKKDKKPDEKNEKNEKNEKKDEEDNSQVQEKEAADAGQTLQSMLSGMVKEKIANKNPEETSFISGILARMSLVQDEEQDTSEKTAGETDKETEPVKEELAKSAGEDTKDQATGLTLSDLVGEKGKETDTAVESASSDGTKTAASRVSLDLSTELRKSILSKVGRAEA